MVRLLSRPNISKVSGEETFHYNGFEMKRKSTIIFKIALSRLINDYPKINETRHCLFIILKNISK